MPNIREPRATRYLPRVHTLYVGLGSNLPDREAHLRLGLHELTRCFGAPVAVSGVYRTAAWGRTDQPDFLNMVAAHTSDLPPPVVLRQLLRIEGIAGRVRRERWGSRTLDLDLLAYGPHVLDTPELQLPHPRLAARNFVLAPLAEIAPDLILPSHTRSVGELLGTSTDPLAVAHLGELPAAETD